MLFSVDDWDNSDTFRTQYALAFSYMFISSSALLTSTSSYMSIRLSLIHIKTIYFYKLSFSSQRLLFILSSLYMVIFFLSIDFCYSSFTYAPFHINSTTSYYLPLSPSLIMHFVSFNLFPIHLQFLTFKRFIKNKWNENVKNEYVRMFNK